MNILISTGVYPPKIGGPAEYSKNLKNALEMANNKVKIATFGLEDYLPTGIRHFYFLVKILSKVVWADYIIAMDTFSVALPTVFLSKIFRKKIVIRTGGDFLWEGYIERTKKKVLFKDFYTGELNNLTKKEEIIFKLIKWILNGTSRVVFSTEWQRNIFVKAYNLQSDNTCIIENNYDKKVGSSEPSSRLFVASSRDLVLKNISILEDVFSNLSKEHKDSILYTNQEPYNSFVNIIKNCYAVVVVSLSEISPNIILDAIKYNKPFICTKEVGIYDRIKDAGIFVDPLNEEEIENAILKLLDKDEYEKACQKVKGFSFVHTWEEIAQEFLDINNSIK